MQHTTVAQAFHQQTRRIAQVCRLAQIGQGLRRRWTRPSYLAGLPRWPADAAPLLPPLALLAADSTADLPAFLSQSPLAVKYLKLFRALDWRAFPQRTPSHTWPGPQPQSPLPYLIALLIRLDQHHQTMGELVDLLRQQPELAWLAGFAHCAAQAYSPSAAAAAVPSAAQFSQMLRYLPNHRLQFLLDQTVSLLANNLPADAAFGDVVSFDTKHIIAWVKENNPKEHIACDRFDKRKQPKGDRDCKLGCKRRSNQDRRDTPATSATSATSATTTPTMEGKPAEHLGSGLGEFYWGYASGVAVTKTPFWGEFVLAEHTATFDQPDVSYFLPLMQQVERRLGRKPRYGAADAAFDAFYVYDYFHQAGGFAAVPNRFGDADKLRRFTPDGVLLCPADLAMALLGSFRNRTSRVVHERQRWVCPLLHPQPTGQPCPIQHAHWHKGGCRTTIAASDGARIRHQLDRHSAEYLAIYNQRTACERIFSQAVALGIERPKLRNARSIANLNTLIYVLLNLRALQRVLDLQAQLTV